MELLDDNFAVKETFLGRLKLYLLYYLLIVGSFYLSDLMHIKITEHNSELVIPLILFFVFMFLLLPKRWKIGLRVVLFVLVLAVYFCISFLITTLFGSPHDWFDKDEFYATPIEISVMVAIIVFLIEGLRYTEYIWILKKKKDDLKKE